jgi:hypothetical protein
MCALLKTFITVTCENMKWTVLQQEFQILILLYYLHKYKFKIKLKAYSTN